MPQGLSVSRVIQTSINLSPTAAQGLNLNTALILGSTPGVIDTNSRLRLYTTIGAVATDFGTTAPEYLAALRYFSQVPQPQTLYIGYWAATAVAGRLLGASLTPTQQLLSNFTAITSGGFSSTINGTLQTITGLNFSAAGNLSAVAAIINTALITATAQARISWNPIYSRFELITTSMGPNKSITPLIAPGTGVDISTLLGGTVAAGATEIDGIAAESALAAVVILDGMATYFYGLTVASAAIADSDHQAIAAYIQSDSVPHYYWISTTEATAINPSSSADIGSLLLGSGFTRTGLAYSSSDPYSGASMMGLLATVNYLGSNTTITAAFKQDPGVTPELLTATQAATLDAKRYNYFVQYANGTAIINNGWSSGMAWIDEIYNLDWQANTIQTNIFNVLYTLPKVPQTDRGMNAIVNAAEQALGQGVTNGMTAPGTWQTGGFGALSLGDYMPTGYYVYAPPMASQSPALRASRVAPVMQIAIKLAGAIQSVSAIINVNR
jgi:hypothetical protein